jgi:hypothetical protein
MREFRPPLRRSKFAAVLIGVLAAVLALAIVGSLAPMWKLAFGELQVAYAIDAGALTISTGGLDGGRTIPLDRVRERRAVELHGARRTRGTALPAFCTGRWSYDSLGAVWQATDCSPHAIAIVAEGEEHPVVLTPPDRERFLADLAAGTPTRIELPPQSLGALRWVFAIAPLVGAVAAAMLVRVLVFGPRRMRYLVGNGRVEVRTVFARKSWPTAGLRARPYAARPTLRLAGTAVGGYYTGLFREARATTRLYATDLAAGVLLEGPARVYLSPEDREGFLAALRAEGAEVA